MDSFYSMAHALDRGRLLFFAGSGISYGSGVPSAGAILWRTSRLFLPQESAHEHLVHQIVRRDGKRYELGILPEVLYHLILEILGSAKALGMWKSLDADVAAGLGISYEPTITHFFLVEYAHRTGLPIFTTNFDCLFERAAVLRGYPLEVVLPFGSAEATAIALLSRGPRPGTVRLFKVHGSIAVDGNLTLDSIRTTVSTIAAVNLRSIAFLQYLSQHHHITFCGYSGRDADYFPLIRAFTERKAVYWIDRFQDKATRSNALSIGAITIEQWPDEVAATLRPELRQSASVPAEQLQERLLDALEEDAEQQIHRTAGQKLLLLCLALHAAGKNRLAAGLMGQAPHVLRQMTQTTLSVLICSMVRLGSQLFFLVSLSACVAPLLVSRREAQSELVASLAPVLVQPEPFSVQLLDDLT